MQGLVIGVAHAQDLCQTDSRNAIVHICCVKTELTIAQEDIIDVGELLEIILHALDDHRRLTVLIDGERHILNRLGGHVDLWQLANLRQYRIVGSHRLPLYRNHLQLRIDIRKERSHQVVESVEYGERHHQGHRCHSDTDDGDAADHIDGVGRLLRE